MKLPSLKSLLIKENVAKMTGRMEVAGQDAMVFYEVDDSWEDPTVTIKSVKVGGKEVISSVDPKEIENLQNMLAQEYAQSKADSGKWSKEQDWKDER